MSFQSNKIETDKNNSHLVLNFIMKLLWKHKYHHICGLQEESDTQCGFPSIQLQPVFIWLQQEVAGWVRWASGSGCRRPQTCSWRSAPRLQPPLTSCQQEDEDAAAGRLTRGTSVFAASAPCWLLCSETPGCICFCTTNHKLMICPISQLESLNRDRSSSERRGCDTSMWWRFTKG